MPLDQDSLQALVTDEPKRDTSVRGEWRGVASLPSEIHEILDDLEALERMIHLMTGGGKDNDRRYYTAIEFLREMQKGRRSEVATMLLGEYGLIIPDEVQSSEGV